MPKKQRATGFADRTNVVQEMQNEQSEEMDWITIKIKPGEDSSKWLIEQSGMAGPEFSGHAEYVEEYGDIVDAIKRGVIVVNGAWTPINVIVVMDFKTLEGCSPVDFDDDMTLVNFEELGRIHFRIGCCINEPIMITESHNERMEQLEAYFQDAQDHVRAIFAGYEGEKQMSLEVAYPSFSQLFKMKGFGAILDADEMTAEQYSAELRRLGANDENIKNFGELFDDKVERMAEFMNYPDGESPQITRLIADEKTFEFDGWAPETFNGPKISNDVQLSVIE